MQGISRISSLIFSSIEFCISQIDRLTVFRDKLWVASHTMPPLPWSICCSLPKMATLSRQSKDKVILKILVGVVAWFSRTLRTATQMLWKGLAYGHLRSICDISNGLSMWSLTTWCWRFCNSWSECMRVSRCSPPFFWCSNSIRKKSNMETGAIVISRSLNWLFRKI